MDNNELRDELVALIRRAAQDAEDMPCNESTEVGEDGRYPDCPSCSMPVEVSASVGNKIVTVYADVEPLVDMLLEHLQLTVEHRAVLLHSGVGPFYGEPEELEVDFPFSTIERRFVSDWKQV